MKKITKEVVGAFIHHERCKKSNTWTDGRNLYLFGNKIAWYDLNDKLWISNCGFFTNTTKERLNAIPNVRIYQRDFKWYLNGKEWDGNAIRISTNM
jgi:hypothetical protein